ALALCGTTVTVVAVEVVVAQQYCGLAVIDQACISHSGPGRRAQQCRPGSRVVQSEHGEFLFCTCCGMRWVVAYCTSSSAPETKAKRSTKRRSRVSLIRWRAQWLATTPSAKGTHRASTGDTCSVC